MAGSKEAGPAARLVAENLRRVRQERGLTYAELARRLEAIGHHLSDTALLKTEKGDRRATVDDLAALAVALGTTPGRLLLPAVGAAGPAGAPWGGMPPRLLWAWAGGEVALGRPPALAGDELAVRAAEAAFSRESRPHLQNVPAPAPPARGKELKRLFSVEGITAAVAEAFSSGLSTADIRAAFEAALMQALESPDPQAGALARLAAPPESPDAQEAQ